MAVLSPFTEPLAPTTFVPLGQLTVTDLPVDELGLVALRGSMLSPMVAVSGLVRPQMSSLPPSDRMLLTSALPTRRSALLVPRMFSTSPDTLSLAAIES